MTMRERPPSFKVLIYCEDCATFLPPVLSKSAGSAIKSKISASEIVHAVKIPM